MRFVRLASFAALALALASSLFAPGCSSDDSPSGASNAAAANASSTSASGSASSSTDAGEPAVQTTDASSGETDACRQIAENATSAVWQAHGTAGYSSQCDTDDDCVLATIAPACNPSCPGVYPKNAVAALQAAQSAGDADCAQFVAEGCVAYVPPCETGGQVAICSYGYCTSGYPAAWTSFSLEADTGGSGSALPAACSGSGSDCVVRTITPDGSVVHTSAAGTTTTKLASADFTAIDTILRSQAFRNEETNGITCGLPAAGETRHVSESIGRGTILLGADITGCITAGPAGNDFVDLYNVVVKY